MRRIIGLSLSGCLASIVRGDVDARRVVAIHANTFILNRHDWRNYIERNANLLPAPKDRNAFQNLVWKFLRSGRIKQARLTRPNRDLWGIAADGIWIPATPGAYREHMAKRQKEQEL